jgi:hypothetical protein
MISASRARPKHSLTRSSMTAISSLAMAIIRTSDRTIAA